MARTNHAKEGRKAGGAAIIVHLDFSGLEPEKALTASKRRALTDGIGVIDDVMGKLR
jgi:hypothetical protein